MQSEVNFHSSFARSDVVVCLNLHTGLVLFDLNWWFLFLWIFTLLPSPYMFYSRYFYSAFIKGSVSPFVAMDMFRYSAVSLNVPRFPLPDANSYCILLVTAIITIVIQQWGNHSSYFYCMWVRFSMWYLSASRFRCCFCLMRQEWVMRTVHVFIAFQCFIVHYPLHWYFVIMFHLTAHYKMFLMPWPENEFV